MSDNIKVASMIASISANTTEFEAGMNRAVASAEKSFARINQIQAGGFKEGLRLPGMESSASLKYNAMADILGDSTEKKIAEGVEKAATSSKVKQAAESTASTFGQRVSMAMSNQNLFMGIKKAATAKDVFSGAGGIGIALGGWSLAIGAAAEGLKAMAPMMDQILFGTQANTEAAKAYADEIRKTFELSQDRGQSERVAAMAAGSFKPPDWIENFVKHGGLFGDKSNEISLQDSIRNERERLQGDLRELGNQEDFVRAGMIDKHGSTMPFTYASDNLAAEYEFKREYQQMQRALNDQIKSLTNAINNLKVDQIRTALEAGQAVGGFAGNLVAGLPLKNALAQTKKVQDGIGGFVDRYFKAQQEFAKADPLAAFKKENDRISKDLADGVINDQQANVLRGRARQGLDSAMPVNQPQFASLIRANTAEASRAILSAMLPKVKPEDRPLKELKDEAERQTEILRQIGENTARQLQPAGF
jgi:hypothetical protein